MKQESNNAAPQSQQGCYATLFKSHPRTDQPPKICSTSTEHSPLGEQLWVTDAAWQKNFNMLKL